MKVMIYVLLMLGTFVQTDAQELLNKGKFSGLMFGDYFYNISRDSEIANLSNVASGGEKDLNGFQFRRIYFTYDYNISEKFSTRFRLEADQEANTSNGKIGVFVKDAYLEWNDIFAGSSLIFGIAPTPAFAVSESFWGNRFLEKTIMDLRGIVSSRDISISLKGRLDNEGIFNYWLMFGNGSGNRPEIDKYKRYYAHVEVKPTKNISATLYADWKARPKIENPNNSAETLTNHDLTYALFLGYKEKRKYSLGVEGFLTQRQNGNINQSSIKDRNGFGVSFFGSYTVIENISLVGRFDRFDPNANSDIEGDSRNWFLFGLKYSPVERVTISPNVFIETYESLPNGKQVESSITARLTFYFTFL